MSAWSPRTSTKTSTVETETQHWNTWHVTSFSTNQTLFMYHYQSKLMRYPSIWRQLCTKTKSWEHLITVVILNDFSHSLQGHAVGIQLVRVHVVERSRLGRISWWQKMGQNINSWATGSNTVGFLYFSFKYLRLSFSAYPYPGSLFRPSSSVSTNGSFPSALLKLSPCPEFTLSL